NWLRKQFTRLMSVPGHSRPIPPIMTDIRCLLRLVCDRAGVAPQYVAKGQEATCRMSPPGSKLRRSKASGQSQVPDLTSSVSIQVNSRVSLQAHRKGIA